MFCYSMNMFKKLAGYSFIAAISFCFFTLFFHTIANAQSGPLILAQQVIAPTSAPSPTVFVIAPPPTNTPTPQQITAAPTPTGLPAGEKKTEKQTNTVPQVTPTPTLFIVQSTPPPPFFGQPTPTGLPTPTPQPILAPAELDALFNQYSQQYNIDKEQLKKIAKCESNFHTTSNNSGMYLGMYQFAAQTWASVRGVMGLDTNTDLRTNAEESIKTAAYMLSQGRQNAWPNCH